MKKSLLTVVMLAILLLPVSGCEELLLFGGGAAGGLTMDRLLSQAQEDVEENITLLENLNKDLQTKLEQTVDDAERNLIREDIEANLKVIDNLVASKLAIEGTRAGLKTDWSNPQSLTLFGTTALGLLAAYLQRKKKNEAMADAKTKGIALKEIVVGGQQFKSGIAEAAGGDGKIVMAAFKKAQDGAQSTETKKLVAVMRVGNS